MLALVRALATCGGALSPPEAYEWIRRNTDLAGRMPGLTKLSASQHLEREIRFGRQELAEAGLLATVGGVWRMLDAEAAEMSPEQARQIMRQNTRRRRGAVDDEKNADFTRSMRYPLPKPSKGPRPVDWQGIIVRETGPASTYLFRFGESHIWKIGFAAHVETRLLEVNRHIPVELLHQRWVLIRSRPWGSSELAYQMEQRVLADFGLSRTVYERVDCSEEEMLKVWVAAMQSPP